MFPVFADGKWNKHAQFEKERWGNKPVNTICQCGCNIPTLLPGWRICECIWLAAIAVNEDGYHEVLGNVEGMKKDKASWVTSFVWLEKEVWTNFYCFWR